MMKRSMKSTFYCILQVNLLVQRLPKADIYTFENKVLRYQTQPRLVPLALNLRTIEAMTTTLLNAPLYELDSVKLKTYTLKKPVVSAYFGLKVGSEHVSGQTIIANMLDGKVVHNMKVSVPGDLKARYLMMSAAQKEQMCTCLLQALVFYNLIIFKKSKFC